MADAPQTVAAHAATLRLAVVEARALVGMALAKALAMDAGRAITDLLVEARQVLDVGPASGRTGVATCADCGREVAAPPDRPAPERCRGCYMRWKGFH